MKKKILFICITIFMLSLNGKTAFADINIDLGFGGATDPEDSSGDNGFAFGLGIGVDLAKSGSGTIQIRGDWTGYLWSSVTGFYTVTRAERRPVVFLGARYYFGTFSRLALFAEGGPELSYDRKVGDNDDKTRFGFTPGLGLEVRLPYGIVFGWRMRYHLISYSYADFGGYFGFRF